MEIKGTGKRLVPKRDIDYLEQLKANHSDPSASWGGTEVVANPTPGEDDPALTGLKVGDTKYKVPGEKKIYNHRLKFTVSVGMATPVFNFTIDFIANNNTPITIETLRTIYGVDSSHIISISASYFYDGFISVFTRLYISSDNRVTLSGVAGGVYNGITEFSALTNVQMYSQSLTDTITEV